MKTLKIPKNIEVGNIVLVYKENNLIGYDRIIKITDKFAKTSRGLTLKRLPNPEKEYLGTNTTYSTRFTFFKLVESQLVAQKRVAKARGDIKTRIKTKLAAVNNLEILNVIHRMIQEDALRDEY